LRGRAERRVDPKGSSRGAPLLQQRLPQWLQAALKLALKRASVVQNGGGDLQAAPVLIPQTVGVLPVPADVEANDAATEELPLAPQGAACDPFGIGRKGGAEQQRAIEEVETEVQQKQQHQNDDRLEQTSRIGEAVIQKGIAKKHGDSQKQEGHRQEG